MSAQCEDRIVKCGKKNKVTTECDKSTVICDVGIVQCDNKIVKYEKKNYGTTKCDKSTVKYDFDIA